MYFNELKRSWFVIGGFPSVLCVSVFQGSLLVIVIMIDGSEKRIVKAAFELQSSRCFEKCSNKFPSFDRGQVWRWQSERVVG